MKYQELIDRLVKNETIDNERLADTFRSVDRSDFLPVGQKQLAGDDRPLPIGRGQTNSQPSTVAFMLEKLALDKGQKVLDVGCGSGWTTALIAHVIGNEGEVIGTELIDELAEFGSDNLEKYDYGHATIKHTPDTLGWPDEAPYDRILVSAAGEDIPESLLGQLKERGVMLIPVKNTIKKITKLDNELDIEDFPGYAFVPLITK